MPVLRTIAFLFVFISVAWAEDINPELIEAAMRGRSADVATLLDEGADVNARDRFGWTPLMRAALFGQIAAVEVLLDRGADVNAKNGKGWTALMEAAKTGYLSIVELLLVSGADIAAKDRKGYTALREAKKSGHSGIVELLENSVSLHKEADIQVKETVPVVSEDAHEEPISPPPSAHLTKAVPEREVEVVVPAVSDAAHEVPPPPPGQVVPDENTEKAIEGLKDDYDEKIILQAFQEARMEVEDTDGLTEAEDEDREVFQLAYLKAARDEVASPLPDSTDMEMENVDLNTAMIYTESKKDIMRSLLAKDAQVNVKRSSGDIAALIDTAMGDYTQISGLIKKEGEADLFAAVLKNDTDLLKTFPDEEMDVRDKDGWTPLMYAALNGHTAVVSALLDRGADVNAKSDEGLSVLTVAAAKGHRATVETLLENGADVNAKSVNGLSALMAMAGGCDASIARLLLQNGAGVNAKDSQGATALMYAAMEGCSDNVRILLDKGADVNEVTRYGLSALMDATIEGHSGIVKLLKQAGAVK